MAEDLLGSIEQLEYAFIAYRVVNVSALFASHHDISVTQHRELLRSISRLDRETLTDLVDCQLALTQRIEDRDSQGMGQRPEEFRFEITELLSHPELSAYLSLTPDLSDSRSFVLTASCVQIARNQPTNTITGMLADLQDCKSAISCIY